ncbi:MAG: hypothetical protein HY000_14180 [Planctomycetes bacterium]|nr:hypothetical protein [Planctomycetota bacterium]
MKCFFLLDALPIYCGRGDEMLKVGGIFVSPFEVESCLMGHPAVLEAAAVESPDPIRGMVIKAFLVLRPEFQHSESLATEIQDYVRRTIAPYKHPRKLEFVAALPKTTSGKIKRRELREREGGSRIEDRG